MPWLRVLIAIALGVAVRSLCYDETFADGRVYFYGTDAWYHMRRIVFALGHGFKLPDFGAIDPYLNFPEGGQGYWGPLFDWSVAALLKVARVDARHSQEAVAAFLPAVLGGLCAVPAYLLGSWFWDRKTGVIAAFFIALLPGHVLYSELGNLDHHVVESLLFGLILYCLLSGLITAGALFILALYLVTPITSNIHMGVLWVTALSLGPRAERAGHAFLLGAGLLLIPTLFWMSSPAAGIRPWGDLPKWLMIERNSLFQPLLLLFAGLTLFAAARFRRRDARFWAALAASAVILVVFAAPVLTGIDVLLRGNPDVQFTEETQPLLRFPGQSGLYLGFAADSFSWAFFAFPVFIVYVFWKEPERRAFSVLGAALFVLVLMQMRFVHVFSYVMAIALAWATARLFLEKKLWPAAALALLVVFWPCLSWIDAFAGKQKYASISKSFYDLCLWMRENTPAENGNPSYSVMASWDLGNALVYLAERAVVADPFNHGFEVSARFFTAIGKEEALALLNEKRARYVIPVNLSHPYIQQIFLTYSRRTEDHPLRHGDGSPVYQMKLLRGQTEHRPLYRAPDGSVSVFELTTVRPRS